MIGNQGPTAVGFRSGPAERRNAWARGLRDLADGTAQWRFWFRLSVLDIRSKYRRLALGPVWTLISLVFVIVMLGSLYSQLFDREAALYIPHLCVGFMMWTLISGMIMDSGKAFTAANRYLRERAFPLSTFVYRILSRHLIALAVQFPAYIGVAIVFSLPPTAATLLLPAGLILNVALLVPLGLLLGIVVTRYRDVGEIVSNLMRVVFFLTPVLWMPDMLGGRAALAHFNPVYHAIEVVRAPLLGSAPPAESWLVMGGLVIAGWLVTVPFLGRYRHRVPFWLM